MISVSIVTYNTDPGEMERCLRSLRSPLVSDIYVVDNSSSAIMRDFCSVRSNVTYMPGENVGFGAGHNRALRKVLDKGDTRYHLVVNSDVSFSPDVLDELSAFMDSHEDVGMVQPEIMYPDGTPQFTARLLPTPLDVFSRRFLPPSWFRKREDRYLMKGIDRSRPFETPYLQGSFLFIRVEVLRRVGLFDERFFMYPEDIDLTRRVNTDSLTLSLPGIRIVHDHRRASYKSFRMLMVHIVNMARYFNKWGWWRDSARREVNRRCGG